MLLHDLHRDEGTKIEGFVMNNTLYYDGGLYSQKIGEIPTYYNGKFTSQVAYTSISVETNLKRMKSR